MEAVLAGLNGEVVTECQTLQTAACERNCQYIGLWCFFFGVFCLSFSLLEGVPTWSQKSLTSLISPPRLPERWQFFIMLSLSSKLMRGGHAMIWLRVFLLVFGVLSQKNKHPFTRWPSERTVLKRCILLETSTNTTLGWRLVLQKHWPRVPSRWVSFPRSHFPLLWFLMIMGGGVRKDSKA